MMELSTHHKKLVSRAKAYPFGIPTSSYLFISGECWPIDFYNERIPLNSIVRLNDKAESATHIFTSRGMQTSSLAATRIPVLASGSNASPVRLKEKFYSELKQTVIPVIQYSVKNLLPVFSAKFASYGSITATLQQAQNTETKMFVTFLSLEQLQKMHQTEAIGDEYDFVRLRQVEMRQITSEPTVQKTVYAYLSRKGVFDLHQQQFTLDSHAVPVEGFAYRTQTEMLIQAHHLLNPRQDLEEFILQNITNDKNRRQNNLLLGQFSRPFGGGNTTKITDDPSSLF
ncbi:MAG: hypothetical protein VX884_03415 [Pseudomonadota bacterium]|nr:hypothetical protein [Pseudomonadota bacterium]